MDRQLCAALCEEDIDREVCALLEPHLFTFSFLFYISKCVSGCQFLWRRVRTRACVRARVQILTAKPRK